MVNGPTATGIQGKGHARSSFFELDVRTTAWPHQNTGQVLSIHPTVSSSRTVRQCSPWGGQASHNHTTTHNHTQQHTTTDNNTQPHTTTYTTTHNHIQTHTHTTTQTTTQDTCLFLVKIRVYFWSTVENKFTERSK